MLLIGAEVDRLSACTYKDFGGLTNPYSMAGKKLSRKKMIKIFSEVRANNLYLT